MRLIYTIILGISVIVLLICSYFGRNSEKKIGGAVGFLNCAIVMPIIGNALIIISGNATVALVGYYLYFVGMDLIMFSLLRFCIRYCSIPEDESRYKYVIYALMAADVVQYALNPLTSATFTLGDPILQEGYDYYVVNVGVGQTVHRIIGYGTLALCFVILIRKVITTPKIYIEKYAVILAALMVAALWETFYIVSRSPMDVSMIGFAAFGVMTYYFALYYRPMRLLDSMLARIVSQLGDAVYFHDASGRCIWANGPGREFLGIDENYDEVPALLTSRFGALDRGKSDYSLSRKIFLKGEERYYEVRRTSMEDERTPGKQLGFFMVIRDNTDEQRLLRQKIYNSTHDPLTGLYTKEHLFERIAEKLDERPDVEFNVIFVDVKNFKIVNDIFGTAFGDLAIKCIAGWLQGFSGEDCLYGRIAGDTFGLFVPAAEFDEETVSTQLDEFRVYSEEASHHVIIHLGVYTVVNRAIDVSVMFDRAHLALSVIKDDLTRHIAYYDEDMRKSILWSQEISAELDSAIANGDVQPYLQPIVDADGKIKGAEALVRWIHPEKGFLSPAEFVPVFEKNGMIVKVDRYMWRCACSLLKKWNRKDLFISVNISPKDFYLMDVHGELLSLVKEYGLEPQQLRVEITETLMMNGADEKMVLVEKLRRDGFIVEMDDFGSGYSSLNLLKDMPVDVLKIDMMFLRASKENEKAGKILENIVRLSNDLRIVSLSEGVETVEQYGALAGMGCVLFQGYYFSKPLPVDKFESYAGLNA